MLSKSEEKELVRRLSKGDEEAFTSLYVHYRRILRSFCFGFLKSDNLSTDIVQDVFLKVWDSREMLDCELSFSSLLFTMTRNRVYNEIKHIAVSDRASEKFVRENKYRPTAADLSSRGMEEEDYIRILEQAVARLSNRQREVFILSRNRNLSQKEIAEQLGLSVYTVQEYISGALRSIKTYVAKHADICFVLFVLLSIC